MAPEATEPTEPLRTIDDKDPEFQRLVQNDAKQYFDEYAETTAAIRNLFSGQGGNADMAQVIRSLKSKPELAKMPSSKAVLAQCGIQIDIEVKEGKEVVVVMINGVVV